MFSSTRSSSKGPLTSLRVSYSDFDSTTRTASTLHATCISCPLGIVFLLGLDSYAALVAKLKGQFEVSIVAPQKLGHRLQLLVETCPADGGASCNHVSRSHRSHRSPTTTTFLEKLIQTKSSTPPSYKLNSSIVLDKSSLSTLEFVLQG